MTSLRLHTPARTAGRVLGALGASALLAGLLAGCTGDAQTPVQSGVVEPTSADDGSTRTPTNEPTPSEPSETATPAT
ncbi:hypothetical protein GSU68_00915 [Rathayibacter sp. VKM Ac-2759]|uniref:hypothetical protein n=1 Tax=Rathayibacter sp. VKM Ac-2759 TaxID=2609252 RepID=UPI0013182BF0|nr:hypothetical protein [Rathayibacter sp. VKM Ac-2759]QHC65276.1 hypothetical protein GSU68_00915 [Rathayibacter sp. VKM Ac-2759]